MSCPGRHHEWDTSKSPPVCRKCGDPKKPAGRPKGSGSGKSDSKKQVGATVAGRLAATLGVTAPPPRAESLVSGADATPATLPSNSGPLPTAAQDAAAAAPAASQAAPSVATSEEETKAAPPAKLSGKYSKGWTARVGPKLAKGFVGALELIGEAFHRRCNDPDDDDVDDLGDELADQLKIWFPDVALTPGKAIILSSAFIATEMFVGSEKIPRKEDPKPPALPAAVTGKPALQMVPPPPPPVTAPVRAADTISDATRPPI